jgi:glutamate N-acetyltransferase/amino-acid N-acetyltransferase
MILMLSNGVSGTIIETQAQIESFQHALDEVLIRLAQQVVKDGEGATKLVEIFVRGASTDADAKNIARTVANSNLVKTAFFGEDANWGRILGAAGRAGVPIEPDKVDICFDDVLLVENGAGCGDEAEAEATIVLQKSEFSVTIDLNMGNGSASIFTCDFSVDYVKINADYRT